MKECKHHVTAFRLDDPHRAELERRAILTGRQPSTLAREIVERALEAEAERVPS